MCDRRTKGGQLRGLWKGMPDSLIPRVVAPARLTHEDTQENYKHRDDDGVVDPIALLDRIRRGVKPMGTLLIRRQREFFMTQTSVMTAASKMGMRSLFLFARGGRQEVIVYQEAVTLGQFYDPEDTIARYRAVGVELSRDLFDTALEVLARPLVKDDFPASLKYPLMGMCLGYPVQETIDFLKCTPG